MKKNLRLAACLFVFALSAEASSHATVMNASKVDPRLSETVNAVENNQPAPRSNILGKYSTVTKMYSVIVYANSIDEVRSLNIIPSSFNGKLFTASVTYDQLLQLSNLQSVSYIEAPRMRYPKLDVSIPEMKVDKLHQGLVNTTVYKGKGVIVGVIDTGIDWKHEDFRSDADTTQSRILFLRDMTTGKEFTQAQINNELDGTPAGVVDEQDINGHGTHVASTAAGDGSTSGGLYTGVAPEADLIIVKAGDGGFATDNIINGITYIRQKADSLGKPFVINMSLGGHDGSHDGTAAEEIAVDAEVNGKSGRQIIIAAGNEGSDAIHVDGTVTQGGTSQFQFTIPAYTANAGTQNDYVLFDMWYKMGDYLTVSVKTPNNNTVTAASGATGGSPTAQGNVSIFNANTGVNPKNNSNECSIQIFDLNAAVVPASGVWTVTVTGATVTQGGSFDIWIAGSTISDVNGNSPSFVSPTFTKLVGMPGTVETGITVGAYETKWQWPAIDNNTYHYNEASRIGDFSTFSSMGPTRDGRQKPDVSAPGQAIAAAMSESSSPQTALQVQGGGYVIEQGTSMATPHVAGLVALMLQAKPTLTTAQIRSALKNTARTDAFTGAVYNPQWGYGKVDAQAVVQSVLSVQRESEIVPAKFVLHQNYPNPFNPETKIKFSIAQRSAVTLKIYSILGDEVTTIVDDQLESGDYSAPFNAKDLASGIYFYTLTAGSFSETKKLIFMK